jgi:class 3 adenylate cyclase
MDIGQVDSAIKNKEITIASVIDEDIIVDGEVIFKKGEIFGAPYNRMSVIYPSQSGYENAKKNIKNTFRIVTNFQAALDEELTYARQEAMRANKEAELAKANEKIAIYERKRAEDAFLKSERDSSILKKFIDPMLVDSVVKHNVDISKSVFSEENIVILFSDIREFTKFSENKSPKELGEAVNDYYSQIVALIPGYGGSIDKYIGDALMVAYGTFNPQTGKEIKTDEAVDSAVEMRRRLSLHNSYLCLKGEKPVHTGIGLNYDKVLAGNLGDTGNPASDLLVGIDKLEKLFNVNEVKPYNIFEFYNISNRLEDLQKFLEKSGAQRDRTIDMLQNEFKVLHNHLDDMKKGVLDITTFYDVFNKVKDSSGVLEIYKDISLGRFDPTTIGDGVNLASRIEGLTKVYGAGILISENLMDSLENKEDIRFLDYIKVKGKDTPVRIFEVYDQEPDKVKEYKKEIAGKLSDAFSSYREGFILEAKKQYEELYNSCPAHSFINDEKIDRSIGFFLKRCNTIISEKGIDELKYAGKKLKLNNWSGVYEFKDK